MPASVKRTLLVLIPYPKHTKRDPPFPQAPLPRGLKGQDKVRKILDASAHQGEPDEHTRRRRRQIRRRKGKRMWEIRIEP